MQTRRLGPFSVSALGLGCMGMSMAYGVTEDAESLATLAHALDRGVTFFDTAELYGNGHNESLLGRAIAGRRHGLQIATKFGLRIGDDGKVGAPVGRPDYIRAACEASLRRLGIDCIDLYFQHRVDPEVPIEDTVGAMADLVKAGKVRHLGLSEAGARTIRSAHAVHPIAAVQTEYSLWSRDVEEQILPACRALGIGFVAYSPLGRGFLAGKLAAAAAVQGPQDLRAGLPRFSAANFAANKALVDALAAWGARRGWTVAQVALAWVMAQGGDIVAIPGTRKAVRLDENLAAAEIALSATDLAEIAAICPRDAVAGARSTPVGLARVNL
jgi:aryl-alcohol dehydrogenase-like predicted oxidoreductase